MGSRAFGRARSARGAWSRAALLLFLGTALAARAEAQPTILRAQWGFPAPVQGVGSDRPGLGAGATVTLINSAIVGYGVDVIWHDWPASTAFRERFDQYLRSARVETIDGTQWGFTALQMTAHVRFETPAHRRLTPWAQLGAGIYRLDLNLDERKYADTYVRVVGLDASKKSWFVPGGYGGTGVDLRVSSRWAFGLDATDHLVFSDRTGEGLFGSSRLPDFSALTFGTHLQYEW